MEYVFTLQKEMRELLYINIFIFEIETIIGEFPNFNFFVECIS